MNEIYEITGSELASLRRQLANDSVTKLSVAIDGGAKFKINERSWTAPMGQRRGLREAINTALGANSPADAMDIALHVNRSNANSLTIGALEAWHELALMERAGLVRRITDAAGQQSTRWELAPKPRAIVPCHRSTHMCSMGCGCRSWVCIDCGTDQLVDRRARYETEAETAPDRYAVEITDCCGAPICDSCVLAATHTCPEPGVAVR